MVPMNVRRTLDRISRNSNSGLFSGSSSKAGILFGGATPDSTDGENLNSVITLLKKPPYLTYSNEQVPVFQILPQTH